VIHVANDSFDLDLGVDGLKFPLGGDGFGQTFAKVVFIEQNLPLQVVEFKKIAIDYPHVAHACTDQRVGRNGTKRAATND
jgi:hypothetical protein